MLWQLRPGGLEREGGPGPGWLSTAHCPAGLGSLLCSDLSLLCVLATYTVVTACTSNCQIPSPLPAGPSCLSVCLLILPWSHSGPIWPAHGLASLGPGVRVG